MQTDELKARPEHEHLVSCFDPSIGYHAIIAIHSTRLGPAVGGTRFWNYRSEQEAVTDVLRLARGMTYKNALAGLPLGGGKSVIIGDNRTTEREKIFRAHGRFIDSLGGRYITAEDVGTSPADMDFVRMETRHVAGLSCGVGDPSPVTARGVFRAIEASAVYRWGSENLSGRTVALQGCGNVGYHLAGHLRRAGAKLVVTDIDPERVRRVVAECGASAVEPEEIYGARADIFAPCALGGVVNDRTLEQFRVEIIAGGANNQLLEERHGDVLEARGILYAPDYVANAGGIINGCIELLGWERPRALRQVDEIYDTVLSVFARAREEGVPTYKAADRIAESRLNAPRAGGGQADGAAMSQPA